MTHNPRRYLGGGGPGPCLLFLLAAALVAAAPTTPTLVLVGENDVRVPPPQSVELYRALKTNGVETHLYIAPREPHGWRELRHELFKVNVEIDWFERHVRGIEYEWESAPGSEDDEDPKA